MGHTPTERLMPWYCMTGDQVMLGLGTTARGLTTAKAADTRAITGPNIIAEAKRISPWEIFFSQFKSILIWILIAASVVSGVLGDATDSLVILAIVILNALVGFYQEYSAEKSIAALRQMTAPRAKVWRDGAVKTIASADVVPGDVLELEAGDLVAADARLLSAASLACVEAALTGEAESVGKCVQALDDPELAIGDRANMVFLGSTIAAGPAAPSSSPRGCKRNLAISPRSSARRAQTKERHFSRSLTNLGAFFFGRRLGSWLCSSGSDFPKRAHH